MSLFHPAATPDVERVHLRMAMGEITDRLHEEIRKELGSDNLYLN